MILWLYGPPKVATHDGVPKLLLLFQDLFSLFQQQNYCHLACTEHRTQTSCTKGKNPTIKIQPAQRLWSIDAPPPPGDHTWKVFTCALEAHISATTTQIDELMMAHTQEISALKNHAAAERAEHTKAVTELHGSLTFLHSAVENIKLELPWSHLETRIAQAKGEETQGQCNSTD